jgi:hypothetical protein
LFCSGHPTLPNNIRRPYRFFRVQKKKIDENTVLLRYGTGFIAALSYKMADHIVNICKTACDLHQTAERREFKIVTPKMSFENIEGVYLCHPGGTK